MGLSMVRRRSMAAALLPLIRRRLRPELDQSGGAQGAGMTPSCCIIPSVSMMIRLSAILPSVNRSMVHAATVTFFPVGGMPRNGPWWVPCHTDRLQNSVFVCDLFLDRPSHVGERHNPAGQPLSESVAAWTHPGWWFVLNVVSVEDLVQSGQIVSGQNLISEPPQLRRVHSRGHYRTPSQGAFTEAWSLPRP